MILTAVYAWRTHNGMGFTGDSIKFQCVGTTGGTAHETVNPVYLMLIWAISKIPIGYIGTRVNVASSLFMVIGCVFFFLALQVFGTSCLARNF